MDQLKKEEIRKDYEYENIINFINTYPNIRIQKETENEEIFEIGRELDRIEIRLALTEKKILLNKKNK